MAGEFALRGKSYILGKLEWGPEIQAVLREMGSADKTFAKTYREEVRILGAQWLEIAREEAPVEHGPGASAEAGTLRDSLTFRTYIRSDGVEMRAYPESPIGKWVIQGTSPHSENAHTPPPHMVFYWERGFAGPGVYRFKHVNHPGAKPNPFLDRAYDRWLPDAEKSLQDGAERWLVERGRSV